MEELKLMDGFVFLFQNFHIFVTKQSLCMLVEGQSVSQSANQSVAIAAIVIIQTYLPIQVK